MNGKCSVGVSMDGVRGNVWRERIVMAGVGVLGGVGGVGVCLMGLQKGCVCACVKKRQKNGSLFLLFFFLVFYTNYKRKQKARN